MMRYFLGLTALLSCSVLASDNIKNSQDIYLLAEGGKHELESYEGNKLGALFGARKISENGFFYGGELGASVYDNQNIGAAGSIDEMFGVQAYIPLGKQFQLSEKNQLNLYGLAGYSFIRLESSSSSASDTVNGVTWGGGMEMSFSDWMVGVRYVKADSDDLEEENLTLLLGHKIKL